MRLRNRSYITTEVLTAIPSTNASADKSAPPSASHQPAASRPATSTPRTPEVQTVHELRTRRASCDNTTPDKATPRPTKIRQSTEKKKRRQKFPPCPWPSCMRKMHTKKAVYERHLEMHNSMKSKKRAPSDSSPAGHKRSRGKRASHKKSRRIRLRRIEESSSESRSSSNSSLSDGYLQNVARSEATGELNLGPLDGPISELVLNEDSLNQFGELQVYATALEKNQLGNQFLFTM